MGERVHHLARLAGRLRAHAHVRDGEGRAVGRFPGLVEPLDPVGVDARVRGVLVEDPGDRVVRHDPAQVDRGRADQAPVDLGAVAHLAHVARRRAEPPDEVVLEPSAAEVVQVLQRHRRVAEDLHGLDRRDLVEEPPARGVHEEPVALELEELAGFDACRRIEHASGMRGEERVEPLRAPIEEQRGVVVAGRPRVLEVRGGARLEVRVDLIAEPVEGVAKRRPPALVPVAARAAAAIGAPALDAVGAAPRGLLADRDLVRGRVGRQERAVVREGRRPVGFDLLDRGGQRHLAEAAVMAVGLAVRCAVHELRPGARVGEGGVEPRHEVLGALQQPLERDRARDGSVVEKERQAEPVRSAPEIGTARVDPAAHILPGLGLEGPHAERLVGRQDRVLHAGLGEHLERLSVHRRLRKPEPLGLAPEPLAKVLDSPAHLRDLVAARGERHDHVVEDLRARVAMTPGRDARAVGLDDLRVHVRPVALEPGEERRPDVERDLLEVVDDVEHAVLLVDAAGRRVRRVALRGHPLVPVVLRRRRVLDLDRLEPGILPRRLVEVAVDDDRAVQNSSIPRRNSRRPPRGTTTRPEASTW